jgi:hypothetical protein
MARETPDNVSSGEETSRTTVFMVPPRNIHVEIGGQAIRRRERGGEFRPVDVPRIPLLAFVVVTNHPPAIDDIGQTVIEERVRGWYGRGHRPNTTSTKASVARTTRRNRSVPAFIGVTMASKKI